MNRCKAGLHLLVLGYLAIWMFASPAWAQSSSYAQRLYGTWYTYPLGNPNTDSIRHEFRHNADTGKDELVITHICQGDYSAVIAKATAPIEVTENSIRILKSVSRTEGVGASECKASVDAGVLGYIVSADGNRISITNPGGVPDMFELARQEAAKDVLLPTSIFGSWLLPVQHDGLATVQIKLIFFNTGSNNSGKIREISTCSKANDSVVSQVDARVRITKKEIAILDDVKHAENGGPITCTASITPGTLRYVVAPTGGTMVITKQGEPPITLVREQ